MTVEGLEEIAVHVGDVRVEEKTSKLKYLFDSVIDFTAGTLGGFANCLVAQPFDTVKVKLQTFPGDYRSTLNCFARTFQNDGLARGLYAGFVPAMFAHVAENAVLFTFYGLCQKTVMNVFGVRNVEEMTVLHSGLAGSGASCFSSLVLCPTELVKCRMQVYQNMLDAGRIQASAAYDGTWHLCRHIIRQEGYQGFYRGFSGTIIREVPGYFCFFSGYELSRTLLTPEGKSKNEIGILRTMFSGGIGGMALWVVIYPIDSVKSRQQVYTHLAKPSAFLPTLQNMVLQEGITSLYRGLAPTIFRTFFATAALFLTYENSKTFLKMEFDDIYQSMNELND